MEGSDVAFTANLGAGNDLDEIRTCPPGGDNLRGGQRPRDHHHILFRRRTRSRRDGGHHWSEIALRHRAQLVRLPDSSHRPPPRRCREWSLTNWEMTLTAWGTVSGISMTTIPPAATASAAKRAASCRVDANRSDNAGFLEPAPHLEFLHVVVSFGARLSTVVEAVTDQNLSKSGFPATALWIAPKMPAIAGCCPGCGTASKCRFSEPLRMISSPPRQLLSAPILARQRLPHRFSSQPAASRIVHSHGRLRAPTASRNCSTAIIHEASACR